MGMSYVGEVYSARLLGTGKLEWSDGDVWTRRNGDGVESPKQEISVVKAATEAGRLEYAQLRDSPTQCSKHTSPQASRQPRRQTGKECIVFGPAQAEERKPLGDSHARPLRGRCHIVSEPVSGARY